MKKNIFLFLFLITALSFSQVTISPNPFEINEQITITINQNSTATNCNGLVNPTKVYMHAGIGNDNDPWGFNVIGNWGQDDGVGEMTNIGGGNWSITLTPETYFGLNATQASNATKMGMVFRNASGTQEFKANGCADFIYNVGTFQVSLSSPSPNSVTIMNSGGNLSIAATNIGGNANYVLKANEQVIHTVNNVSTYSYNHTNITSNQNYKLEATLNGTTIVKEFSVIINPGTNYQVMPSTYQNGITYLNDTEAMLVLYATGKDFVYVAGSFNNWQPDSSYAMKIDPTQNNKFWLKLTGLTPGQVYTYQYWVVDQTPPTNSPVLVKTADPYSTQVLSPYDDPWIPSNSFPDLNTSYAYPSGQEREVTVLQTAQTPYNWVVSNFTKPSKEDLVIYELLIRDFDADRNYQDVIDKIDYFKNLGINAIELMPVMEFEGNESWGYNTAFHMALDKFYGTENKLKELIDLCHQNGIAVIMDIAFNHAFGRNPMVRMWMNDPDGDGWGSPNSSNPYFNTVAKHSYSVGEDFNHQSIHTKDFVKRTIKRWIEDFKIDGFRWDLTKGFTQQCTAGDETCTNGYRSDRVAVLKEYADYQWTLDPDFYVIFEHLGVGGSATEETEWANYRYNEGKGIMLWGELFYQYKQLAQGYASGADISGIGHVSRGYNGKRLVGYPESHDKDRLMYEAVTYGVNTGTSPIGGNLTNALNRMPALGATSLLVPGPKMIWHFQELGMDDSIYTCNNGTINSESDATPGDCKLDTKPQPQWVENWENDAIRGAIYDQYSKLIHLKINEPVFEGDYTISPNSDNLKQRIYVYDNSLPATSLKNVVVLANFSTNSTNITPDFPYTGTWYNLMDNSTINVTSTTTPITIPAGEFRVYGNQPSVLNNQSFIEESSFLIFPNPVNSEFFVSENVDKLEIYTIAGQRVYFKENAFKSIPINISNLQKGIYIVKATKDNQSISRKLVKD